jgi:hypothetical protein
MVLKSSKEWVFILDSSPLKVKERGRNEKAKGPSFNIAGHSYRLKDFNQTMKGAQLE